VSPFRYSRSIVSCSRLCWFIPRLGLSSSIPPHLRETVMSSSSSPLSTTKSANNSQAQTPPAPQSQSGPATGTESHHSAQRRSGGSGSIGAGSASLGCLSSPRNSQSFRKPHKNQRKPRLADEDAMAESVSYSSGVTWTYAG
jgi:hypothetical protein